MNSRPSTVCIKVRVSGSDRFALPLRSRPSQSVISDFNERLVSLIDLSSTLID
ncbi:MAG: hypothetical protein H3C43_11515 [Leptonema sp. (in: Bacteria)]|nr:hypothetical protein [Leptonema sp. (in: bacteria)]